MIVSKNIAIIFEIFSVSTPIMDHGILLGRFKLQLKHYTYLVPDGLLKFFQHYTLLDLVDLIK